MSVANEIDQLLTPAEVAGVLGMGREYVYSLVNAGDLPSIKIGSARRIRTSALNTWINAH